MSYAPNLDAYFARIGYEGERRPTLAALNAIVLGHVRNIPFENIDVLLGRGIDLTPEAVENKLVESRRGGYCFEQNTLLLHVLRALGYEATPLSARVRLGRPRDMTPPRTHVFIRVWLDAVPWLVDVGVGAMSPTCALRFDTEVEQATPHEPRRLVWEGAWSGEGLRDPSARIFHQVRLGDEWQDVCELTLEEMPEIDREVANWFTSTHPQSHFRGRLMAARATESGRVTLVNRELTVRGADGVGHVQVLETVEELLSSLVQHFGLVLPADTRFACPALDFPPSGV